MAHSSCSLNPAASFANSDGQVVELMNVDGGELVDAPVAARLGVHFTAARDSISHDHDTSIRDLGAALMGVRALHVSDSMSPAQRRVARSAHRLVTPKGNNVLPWVRAFAIKPFPVADTWTGFLQPRGQATQIPRLSQSTTGMRTTVASLLPAHALATVPVRPSHTVSPSRPPVADAFMQRRKQAAMRSCRALLRRSEDEDAAVEAFQAAVISAHKALGTLSAMRAVSARPDDRRIPSRPMLRAARQSGEAGKQDELGTVGAAALSRSSQPVPTAASFGPCPPLGVLPDQEEALMALMARSSSTCQGSASDRERAIAALASQQLAWQARR